MRFLFTTNPLTGHWFPMLPLAAAAVRAGHEVVVATGPDLVGDVERRGFRAWSIGPDLPSVRTRLASRPRAAAESKQERVLGDAMVMFADPGLERARDLLTAAQEWTPDIVVREIYELGGAYLPARLQVLHGVGSHYPGFVGLAQLASSRIAGALGPPAWDQPLGSSLYVDPFPAGLQPPDDTPFADVLRVRPEAGRPDPDPALERRLAALPYASTVYLTLGTFFNGPDAFAEPLAALHDLPVNVVVTCGEGVDPESLGPQPAQVMVARFIPQALLMPRVGVMVCHAGAGTLIGALAAGVPVVSLPRGADQFGNAAQVARRGAGLTLGPDAATPPAIVDAVRSVLTDPAYATAARALAEEIAAMPDADVALDALVARVPSWAGAR